MSFAEFRNQGRANLLAWWRSPVESIIIQFDRDAALNLLRAGQKGVVRWNLYRRGGTAKHRDSSKTRSSVLQNILGRQSDGVLARIPLLLNVILRDLVFVLSCVFVSLEAADINEANMVGLDLGALDLTGVDFEGALLDGVDFSGIDLSGSRMVKASLRAANLRNVHFIDTDLYKAKLTGSDLTLARFVRANMEGADVEDTLVADVHVQELRGLPKPPARLRLDQEGRLTLTGADARWFFVRSEPVEVVLDQVLSDERLELYARFVSSCRSSGECSKWFEFVGGRIEGRHTILSFRGIQASDVIVNLPLLLDPFRLSYAIDWKKSLGTLNLDQAEDVVNAMLNVPVLRSHVAARLQGSQGFGDSAAMSIRLANQIVEFKVDADAVAALRQPGPAPFQIAIIEGGQQMTGDYINIGGDVVGGAVGRGANVKGRNINVFKQAVDQSSHLDPELKDRLKAARDEIAQSELDEDDAADALEHLQKLASELGVPDPKVKLVRRCLDRIAEVAPSVASILSTAATITKVVRSG